MGSIDKAFFAAGIYIRGVVPSRKIVGPDDEHSREGNIPVQAVLPDMVAANKVIVNMSSDFAVMAVPAAAAYMAAKSASIL